MTKAINSKYRWVPILCYLFLPMLMLNLAGQWAGAAGTTAMSGDVSIEFEGGGLELVSIPTFDFGRHPRPTVDTYYAAQRIGPDPVTVQDLDGRGWKLMAKLSTSSGSSLSGSSLHFNTEARHVKSGSGVSPGVSAPTASSCEIRCDSAAVEVCGAVAGSGSGVWMIDWEEDSAKSARTGSSTGCDVELKVLASNAKVGKVQALLDWDLIVAP